MNRSVEPALSMSFFTQTKGFFDLQFTGVSAIINDFPVSNAKTMSSMENESSVGLNKATGFVCSAVTPWW